MSNLVIVESPAKAKTIKKYLGDNFDVVASMGHVRDLPKSKLGVDIEKGFEPSYVEIDGKSDLIKTLKNKATTSDAVYLATDPDREGEAISWHLAKMLGLDVAAPTRVTFNEITKTGVKKGMDSPRIIDIDLVNAQQARRILDRIVGYKLSPFLWKKIKRGLSAGRVQSVAVRLIVDREEEIRAFVPDEYWTLDALMLKGEAAGKPFEARFHGGKNGKKIEITNKEQADGILASLKGASYTVANVKRGERKKNPAPPFITSTLQQDASRKLGFTAKRTMKAAQELYEGMDVKGYGTTGLITYMRTDSLRVSEQAIGDCVQYIKGTYGDRYLPGKPRHYKGRANAQDAHEAIRPTIPGLPPAVLRGSLTDDQFKLYKLIWERFTASQMATALYDTTSVDIAAGEYIFKSSGYVVKFDGFTVLYTESQDNDEESGTALPRLEEGEVLTLKELNGNQHFTQPPPRFTEASLIKALEENGIGRPSTYAPTISTILSREYIEREKKLLKPTALGEVTTGLMRDFFKDIVDVDFTANMEKSLDSVESGELDWSDTLQGFYSGFERTLTDAEQKMDGTRIKIPEQETDEKCENCGRNMVIKSGRFGKFMACPGYPECKNTKPIVTEAPGECPLCGGKILERKSQKGYKFYACEKGTDCKFITWDTPQKTTCPECEKTLFRPRYAKVAICENPACGSFVPEDQRGYKKKTDAKTDKAAKAPAKSKTAKTTKTAKSTVKKSTTKSTTKKPAAKTAKKTGGKTAKSDE